MASVTFSALPVEIHVIIAKLCEKNDLINLCLTSKQMNETCLHVLYRHVEFGFGPYVKYGTISGVRNLKSMKGDIKRQKQFVRTLLSHPEYGKYVRILKGTLFLSGFDASFKTVNSNEKLWRAMRSLTHVQDVDLALDEDKVRFMMAPTTPFPNDLFQLATSVRLVGHMQYGLAKSILNAIHPATLEYLCLDMVRDSNVSYPGMPVEWVGVGRIGDRGEHGRIVAHGATSGLLTTLTGHCTALRTLILRRLGQSDKCRHWHAAAEDASYIEWADFIRSVQGTVEKLTFEQAGKSEPQRQLDLRVTDDMRPDRIMDQRFRRLVLPVIVAGSWPCLTTITLQGVQGSKPHGGTNSLETELRAVLGENVKITTGRGTCL